MWYRMHIFAEPGRFPRLSHEIDIYAESREEALVKANKYKEEQGLQFASTAILEERANLYGLPNEGEDNG